MEETLRMLEEELRFARLHSEGHHIINAIELVLQIIAAHGVEYADLPRHGGDKHF